MSSEVQEQSASYNLADLKPALENTSGNNTLLDSLPIWLSAQTTKSAGRVRSADNTYQYGVQKLRDLILELAVRGKLVEQDPGDEPASGLLVKIAEEKVRLVKEGKIKKQKTIPNIDTEEQPYELPSGWCWTRLGTIAFKLTDGSHNPPRNAGSGFPMLSSQNVNFGQIDFSNPSRFVTEIDFEKEDQRTKIKPGDVLLTIVASLGRAAVVPEDAPPFTLQRSVAVINSKVVPKYLAKQLVSPTCLKYYDEHGKGTAQKGIYLGKLSLMPIALPPLAEQHRIVKKVDELMSLCDQLEQQQADAVQAHDTLVKVLLDTLTKSDNADDFQQNWRRIAEHFDTLFTTESSIDQFKQTLLQLAVMGKLVSQDSNDEPSAKLIEHSAITERSILKLGRGVEANLDKELTQKDKVFQQPAGWLWTRLGKIINVEGGSQPPKAVFIDTPKSGYTRLIQIRDFKSDAFPTYVPDEHANRPFTSEDVMIGRYGPPVFQILRGKSGTYNVALMRAEPIAEAITKDYLFLLLSEPRIQQKVISESERTAGQSGVRKELIYMFPVCLPPLTEQHRIVKKVDELMALCDQLKARLNQAQTLQQQIANAVVEQSVN